MVDEATTTKWHVKHGPTERRHASQNECQKPCCRAFSTAVGDGYVATPTADGAMVRTRARAAPSAAPAGTYGCPG